MEGRECNTENMYINVSMSERERERERAREREQEREGERASKKERENARERMQERERKRERDRERGREREREIFGRRKPWHFYCNVQKVSLMLSVFTVGVFFVYIRPTALICHYV